MCDIKQNLKFELYKNFLETNLFKKEINQFKKYT